MRRERGFTPWVVCLYETIPHENYYIEINIYVRKHRLYTKS